MIHLVAFTKVYHEPVAPFNDPEHNVIVLLHSKFYIHAGNLSSFTPVIVIHAVGKVHIMF